MVGLFGIVKRDNAFHDVFSSFRDILRDIESQLEYIRVRILKRQKIYLNFSGSSSALCYMFMCCANYSASPKITCLTGVSAYKSIMPMIPHTIISPAPTVTKNIANMPSEP